MLAERALAAPVARADRRARIVVAYLVTSYTLPRQVLRLLSTLRAGSPGAFLAVHHDDRRSTLDPAETEALGVQRIEPPSAVAWGEASQLEMVLRGLRFALERSDFSWLVLLSGQDYPIRPVAEIERRLAAADVDAFIEARPVARGDGDEFALRYFRHWRRMPVRPPRRLLAVREMPSGTWAGIPARTPFGPRLRCHRGSDWFTLSRRAVEAVDGAARTRPALLRHLRRTIIPTEAYAQTVLANEPGMRLSGDYRRFTEWPPGAARPRVLRLDDLERILGSGADFARKFDEAADAAVLDAIDRRVRGA